MELQTEIQKNIAGPSAGAITVKLAGSLDTATAPELENQLKPVLAGPVHDLIFDLTGLKFISSAGLRVFAAARKVIKAQEGHVSFVKVQPQIQEVFNIIEALPGVSIFESVEEMDRYLAARQRAINPNI